MRSYYCRKCNLEFDLEEEDLEISSALPSDGEQESAACPAVVFCPKCLVTIAEALPETPERILARERRITHLRQQEQKQALVRIFVSSFILLLTAAAMTYTTHSCWWMLVLGLPVGGISGFWTRMITSDRSFRAGILSVLIFALLLALCILIPWSCGRFQFTPAVRNLGTGAVLAWIIAIFER